MNWKKDLYNRLTSRTFIILLITGVMYATGHLTQEQFFSINGISFGGTGIKDLLGILVTKEKANQSDDTTSI